MGIRIDRAFAMIALVSASAAGAQDVAAPTAQSNASRVPNANQYICTFNGNVSRGAVATETARSVGPELGEILFIYSHVIKGFAVRLPAVPGGAASVTARLRTHNPNIRSCERDGVVRAAETTAAGRPGSGGTTQSTPWGVTRVGGPGDASGLPARAWVIDSGIDLTHPDLNVDAVNGASFLLSLPADRA